MGTAPVTGGIDQIEAAKKIKTGLKNSTKEALAGYCFLLPNLVGFLVFTSLPVIASLALSFVKWDLLTPPAFAGLKNFVQLFQDRFFWKFCWNTIYLMLGIPLGMIGSLAVALAMNQKIKGIVFFRTTFFLPTICSGVAIFILWRLIYNPDFGFFNVLIRGFGDLIHVPLEGPNWLTDEKWAKPALIIMGLWQGIGGHNMILYLAALQGIPRDLYEASDIDGANGWQKFWAVTWPMISPTTFFIAIMSIIGGFQAGFDAAFIMTGGGPNGSTTTIMYYIYNNAFQWFNMGYAAAISWFLFVVIFVITLLYWKVAGKTVHYY
ncbi:MAG: sugar ABC transporter permease [Candidatus Omnitrophica bacterium]|nr:sugar ABC transporter permease [Candidatus Omnitrophota bacterium]